MSRLGPDLFNTNTSIAVIDSKGLKTSYSARFFVVQRKIS